MSKTTQYFGTRSLKRLTRIKKQTQPMLVADVVTMSKKFHILFHTDERLELVRAWNSESYGFITLSHAKRLINNSK